jgi:beta-lactam-binding protein with PASTA domain
VLGLGESEAVDLLQQYDLVAQVKYAKGRGKCGVMQQKPSAGTVLKAGSDVSLLVAKPKNDCDNQNA